MCRMLSARMAQTCTVQAGWAMTTGQSPCIEMAIRDLMQACALVQQQLHITCQMYGYPPED